MKCPICNKQMKIGRLDPDDSMATIWLSIMPCDCICSHGAPRAVWEELNKTKKALDVATKVLTSIMEHPEDIGDAMDAEDALDQIKQITESPAENVQPSTKSRPVNVQKKMTPEELDELKLLVNATFK